MKFLLHFGYFKKHFDLAWDFRGVLDSTEIGENVCPWQIVFGTLENSCSSIFWLSLAVEQIIRNKLNWLPLFLPSASFLPAFIYISRGRGIIGGWTVNASHCFRMTQGVNTTRWDAVLIIPILCYCVHCSLAQYANQVAKHVAKYILSSVLH